MIHVVYIPSIDAIETAVSNRTHAKQSWIIVYSLALNRHVAALYLGPL